MTTAARALGQRGGACVAEFRPGAVLTTTAWTVHGDALLMQAPHAPTVGSDPDIQHPQIQTCGTSRSLINNGTLRRAWAHGAGHSVLPLSFEVCAGQDPPYIILSKQAL